jgi:hypothetical protein
MFKVFYDNILCIKRNKGFNSYIVVFLDLDIFKI